MLILAFVAPLFDLTLLYILSEYANDPWGCNGLSLFKD